jgi:hypothetical protein
LIFKAFMKWLCIFLYSTLPHKPFAFQWRQAANLLTDPHRMQGIQGITARRMGLKGAAHISVFRSAPAVDAGNFRFTYKVSGILVLPGALCADHFIGQIFIASLLGKYCMPVPGIEGIANIWLEPHAVAAVVNLPVNMLPAMQ